MWLSRSFVTLSILVALPSIGTRALARHESRASRAEDDAQLRELLAKLAEASGEPAPEERTEADLMYEAMLRWNGEPPGSAAIDRALAQSKRDAARAKRATVDKVRRMFWRDPFADDPQRLIPVRQEDRDLLAAYNRKTQRSGARERREAREPRDEVSRLRAELAAAREDAEAARAESARLREGAETVSPRQGCMADASSSADTRRRRRTGGGPARRHHAEVALADSRAARSERYQTRMAPVAPTPVALPPPIKAAPPAHGIIITPLPPRTPPVVETGHRPRR
jgi:hypothetical protein